MLGILVTLAFAGNLLSLHFLGQTWPVGGFAILLLAYIYGLRWAFIAAFLSNLYVLALWVPPLIPVLVVTEAVVVGFFPKRRPGQLLLADIYFWLLIAPPLFVLYEHVYLQTPLNNLPLKLLLNYAVIGLGQALAATALLVIAGQKGVTRRISFPPVERQLNLLAGSFLLPLFVIVGVTTVGTNTSVPSSLHRDLTSQFHGLEQNLVGAQTQLKEQLDDFGLSAMKGNFSLTPTLQRKFHEALSSAPELEWIYAADSKGQKIVPSDPRTLKRSERFVNKNLRRLKNSLGSMLTVERSQNETETHQITLVVPIVRDRRLRGYVQAGISQDFYQQFLLRSVSDTPFKVSLTDSEWNVIATNRDNASQESSRLFSPDRSSVLNRAFVWQSTKKKLLSLTPWRSLNGGPSSSPMPWQLVIDIPEASREPFFGNLILMSLTLLLLPALGASLIILRLRANLSLPLLKLAQLTSDLPSKVKAGSELDWPYRTSVEIDALSQNFKTMVAALEEAFNEQEMRKDSSESELDRLLNQKRWEAFTTGRKLKIEMDRRRRIEELMESLEAAESKYRFLVEETLVGVFIVQGGNLSYVNPRLAKIFGYSQKELEYSPFLNLVHENDKTLIKGILKLNNQEGATNEPYQFQGVCKNGDIIHVEVLSTKGVHKGQTSLLGTLIDISDRKKAEETISHMAYHDPLTGLPNRLLFDARAQQALALADRNGQMAALLFLDLDRFKSINDSLGHSVGDKLLQEFSQRLKDCVRESDTISRFGGDEFNVLISQIKELNDAVLIASKITEMLEHPFQIDGHELYASTSIGIALYPKDGKDVPSLIKHADTALYRAKDLGRNNFQIYSPSMNPMALERMALEASLHRVIERNELRVHYQPQVEITENRIVGLEALVRWEHPHGNLIQPGKFIPLAEETGLIVPIGEWVLRAACLQVKQWQQGNLPPIGIGINVSACQFQKQELPKLVSQVIAETKINPKLINLEITESAVMTDIKTAIMTLRKLHDVGITVSIDDFGTGQSSLSYLKDFPVEYLKIDRAFVRNLPECPQESKIARHIVDMAHSLGLKVIAEGVERVEQLEFLKELGCDEIQGYLFSRPVPAEAMTAHIRDQGPYLEPGRHNLDGHAEPTIRKEWPGYGVES